jgi:DNA-binding NarL/FixJ family response regulator
MGKIKVLIADDHTLLRQGLRKIIELDGNIEIVGEAADGSDVINKARELAPDIILMDVKMPGIDGVEATRAIKRQNPEIKIIVLTMYNNKEYILEMIKAGAIGYVLKDIDGSELLKIIHAGYEGKSLFDPMVATKLLQEFNRLTERFGDSLTQDADGKHILTNREKEVLALVGKGLKNKEIARQLFISDKTVRNHVSNIMRKIKVHDRTQAALYAVRIGLISLEESPYI